MPFEPDKITRSHIDRAVKKIKDEEVGLHSSTGYDVMINGEAYPPKEIMRYAHEQMNGEKVWERSGGEPTNKYLENLGFEIVEKNTNTSIDDLLIQYSKFLDHPNYDELYKWEAVQNFQDNWDIEAPGFEAMFDRSFQPVNCNLWVSGMYYPRKMVLEFINENPEAVRKMFRDLFNEGHGLLERIAQFKRQSDELLADIGKEDKNHYQDDRAITVYLSFRYPEEYYLYKYTMYKDFCDLTGMQPAPKFASDDNITNYFQVCEKVREIIEEHPEIIQKHKSLRSNTSYSDDAHHILTQDVIFCSTKEEFFSKTKEEFQPEEGRRNMDDQSKNQNLNSILFGPPGTGKTYHTVNKALQIVAPEFYEKNKKDRKELTKKYRELLITDWENHKSGQIAMTTFHQSFTYEDFIEGIKPLLIDKNNENDDDPESNSDIGYEIQNGIFKNISELARQESGGKVGQAKGQLKWDREQFNKAEFYKLSLGNINIAEDDEIYQYCLNNDCISIGFLWDEDLTNVEESKINKLHIDNPDYDKHDCTSMAIFRHHLKEGYYVVIASGNHKFRAIGKLVGDYFYDKESPIRYPHFRKVKWIAKDLDLPIDLIYNKNFSQKTIYHLRKQDVKPEFFVRSKATENSSDKKPFVLIIDEINRGNIAQIFGELITLIEEDKREGMDEEMSVSLPYSKQPFSVPSNLHIIGTMNTADRSIEALDTALRRRFTFEEMPPKIRIIEDEGSLKEEKSEIRIGQSYFRLSTILDTVNKRIEKLLDKDHLIGHSYFMDVKEVLDLQRVFYRNIIPLLEEYFYGDKGKIQLVLGEGFIMKAEHSGESDLFAQSEYDDSFFDDREIWELTTHWRYNEKVFEDALNTLLNKKS